MGGLPGWLTAHPSTTLPCSRFGRTADEPKKNQLPSRHPGVVPPSLDKVKVFGKISAARRWLVVIVWRYSSLGSDA